MVLSGLFGRRVAAATCFMQQELIPTPARNPNRPMEASGAAKIEQTRVIDRLEFKIDTMDEIAYGFPASKLFPEEITLRGAVESCRKRDQPK
jgi:hypothetical protein